MYIDKNLLTEKSWYNILGSINNQIQGGIMALEARLIELSMEKLGVSDDQITPKAHFIDDLGADSLDTVELVMALEEEFDIEIPDEDAEKLITVGTAVEYIEKRMAEK